MNTQPFPFGIRPTENTTGGTPRKKRKANKHKHYNRKTALQMLHLTRRHEPIDSSCDNVVASILGEIADEAAALPTGYSIDKGLALLNLLNKCGFKIFLPH
jgi:hypothetical protein